MDYNLVHKYAIPDYNKDFLRIGEWMLLYLEMVARLIIGASFNPSHCMPH